jgi:hypothetical protein
MEFVNNTKTPATASSFRALSSQQQKTIILMMLIGIIVSGSGLVVLTTKLSLTAGIAFACVGVVILIATSVL